MSTVMLATVDVPRRFIWPPGIIEVGLCNCYYNTGPMSMRRIKGVFFVWGVFFSSYICCLISRGLVPLHNACSYGHFEVTEMLIKHGADVNANDLWAFTPLHEAASKSRLEVCSLLLSEGADPTQLNCHSKSAIDVAPTRELQEKLSCEYKGHQLLEACKHGDSTKLKKFLASETVNFKHPYSGDTALHVAINSPYPKRKQIVELLIRKGVHLNEKNKDFLTPLHLSGDRSHLDLMEMLLRHGAKVNALDGLGQTSLHRCAKEDNVQACRILMAYNVDLDIVSLQGYKAAQLAGENAAKLFQG